MLRLRVSILAARLGDAITYTVPVNHVFPEELVAKGVRGLDGLRLLLAETEELAG